MRSPSPAEPRRSGRSGVTLIEMLVVMAIVGLLMGVAYPNVSAGLDGIRLRSAADRAGAFWSAARQRADRYREAVQVVIDPAKNEIRAAAAGSDWRQNLALEPSLRIAAPAKRTSYLLYPGTPSPRFEVLLAAGGDSVAGVRVNVLTGVPEPWDGERDEKR